MGARLERVFQMPVAELLGRSRQEACKLLDRLIVHEPRPETTAVSPDAWEDLRQHFFAGAADVATAIDLLADVPDHLDRTLAGAERICDGWFDLLGYRGLEFGDPIDWHLDPISGRRAPRLHWSRLHPLDPNEVGDCKIVWELNRHQWMVTLGQAYRFTGDDRYAKAVARCLRDWSRENPPGVGINWASSLEVAYRLISWCWVQALLDCTRAFDTALSSKLLAGIATHARHVERYLSHYFSPNTHLTGEALGLFYAGTLFPGLSGARRWQTLGAQILIRECERQILADGVYFEQSTYYQRYTAEIYLHFLILAARNRVGVPTSIAARVRRLLDFLMAVRRPDGAMLQIGDDDGGWLLPFTPRAPSDLRGIFAVAGAFFGSSEYAWASGGPAPETLWLLGPAGARAFGALARELPPTAPSRLFPDGGYAIMQEGWGADAHQMVFDVGPLGCPRSGAHGHADLLSIQCTAFGDPCLVDPGTYCYASHPEWRDYFRSTAAHSTVRVDDLDQAMPAGPFKWRARPRARLRRWISNTEFDFADGDHNAYAWLPDPVIHRRRVLFVKRGFWVIVDDLSGAAVHRVDLCFQFGPAQVTLTRDLWCRARGRRGKELLLRPFAEVPLEGMVQQASIAPIRGWYAPEYGRRGPAPALVYTTRTALPLRIVTLLLPCLVEGLPAPAVEALRDDGRGLVGLALEDGTQIRFDDDIVAPGHVHRS